MEVRFDQATADGATYDVVVLGAGGAGMAAALVAAIDGARVLLVERTAYVGGTTAWSAGSTWIPCTPHAGEVGATDSLAQVEQYLTRAIGDRTPTALRRDFSRAGRRSGRVRREALGRALSRLSAPPRLPERARRFRAQGPRAGAVAVRRSQAGGAVRPGASADPRIHGAGRHDGRPQRHLPPVAPEAFDGVVPVFDEDPVAPCGRPAAASARHATRHGQCARRPAAAFARAARQRDAGAGDFGGADRRAMARTLPGSPLCTKASAAASASPAASFSRPAGSIAIRSGARNCCRASTRRGAPACRATPAKRTMSR